MIYYDGIDLGKEVNVGKSKDSKECIVCLYWYFNYGFKFPNSVCNGCHDLKMLCLNLSNNAITSDISKSEAIHMLQNFVLDDRGHI